MAVMTQREILLEQMAACHNQKAWFVPLSDALAGLSHQQASWKDGSENHSIWQIVNHLFFWNQRWLLRFTGVTPPKMEGSISETFGPVTGTDEEWDAVVTQLDKLLGTWENEVRMADESKLSIDAANKEGDSWYAILTHVTIHNAYHIGQIVTARKRQGSWDPDQGVK
jgi:uncharacterized damage-inducible protein DinB